MFLTGDGVLGFDARRHPVGDQRHCIGTGLGVSRSARVNSAFAKHGESEMATGNAAYGVGRRRGSAGLEFNLSAWRINRFARQLTETF
jgi:hypothetical protein